MIAALVLHGFRAQRRSAQWWTLGIVVLAVLNAAFWPTLDGTDALADLERSLSPELQKAFGAQNLGTEAGYLDGQVYALLLPALLSGVAIAGATALTSGDEGGGRLELLHALPVSRQALWSSRFGSVLLVLAGVTAVVAAVVVASLFAFSLSEAGLGPVLAATVACAVLAAFHAAVSYAAGAFGLARGTAVGIGILVLLAGYVVNFLFPLSETLGGRPGALRGRVRQGRPQGERPQDARRRSAEDRDRRHGVRDGGGGCCGRPRASPDAGRAGRQWTA